MKRIFSLLSWFVGFAILAIGTDATADDFYKGKTIRFIVGQAAGGGYDTYVRMIARHISKHIPGNPATAVENMEGAGSLISANYVYKQASHDGLSVVIFNNSLVVQNALGDPRIRIDFRKLGWVGAPASGCRYAWSWALPV